MSKNIATLVSLVAVIATLAFAAPASATGYDGHYSSRDQSAIQHATKKRVRKKTRRKVRKVVSYSCPMHPDMLSQSPGECPKCGMDLVSKHQD